MNLDNKKLFHIAYITSCVLFGVFIAALVIQFICMLWVCLMPDKLSGFFGKVQIWKPFITDMYPFSRAKAELSSSMLTYAFAILFSRCAMSVFHDLENKMSVSVRMIKKTSVIAIICSVLIPVVHNVAFSTFTTSSFSRCGIDIGMLLFGLAMLVVSLCIEDK